MNSRAFPNSPFLLGFERLERLLERSQKASAEGYPPYNVEGNQRRLAPDAGRGGLCPG